jgi:hypothetical protein
MDWPGLGGGEENEAALAASENLGLQADCRADGQKKQATEPSPEPSVDGKDMLHGTQGAHRYHTSSAKIEISGA